MRAFVLMLLLALTPGLALGQEDELAAMLEAGETLIETRVEMERVQARMDRIAAIYSDPFFSPYRKEYQDLQAELANLAKRYAGEDADYKRAQRQYQRAMKPTTDLLRLALERHQQITDTPANPVLKRRALHAIEADVPKLSVFPFATAAHAVEELEKLIESAATDSNIEKAIENLTASDPALQSLLKDAFEKIEGSIMDLPALERVRKWNEALGTFGTALSAYRALTGTSSDPFNSSALDRMMALVELSGDLSGADSVPLMKTYLSMISLMLGNIQSSYNSIAMTEARLNLTELYNYITVAESEVGDEFGGLKQQALFGRLGPNPIIYPAKSRFKPGEAISGGYIGSQYYCDDAWLGIFRAADVPDSTDADENDRFDLAFVRLDSVLDAGRFSFDETLEPGDYMLRMFDCESGTKVVETAIHVGSERVCVLNAPNTTVVRSSFATGAEGWLIDGDAGPDPEVGAGEIKGTDGERGSVWNWVAPASFLGDQSSRYGRTLTYRLRVTELTKPFEAPDVIIEGGGITLTLDAADPTTVSTEYRHTLGLASAWKKDGRLATEAEFCLVLSNMTSLKIRGEYNTGPDSGWLGAVSLGQ